MSDHETLRTALYGLLGTFDSVTRRPVRSFPDSGGTVDGIGEYLHPVFALHEHFRANDDGNAGYTRNTYRGDHLSIPAYGENGAIAVLETSFHKGDTFVDVVSFDGGDHAVRAAVTAILAAAETR